MVNNDPSFLFVLMTNAGHYEKLRKLYERYGAKEESQTGYDALMIFVSEPSCFASDPPQMLIFQMIKFIQEGQIITSGQLSINGV